MELTKVYRRLEEGACRITPQRDAVLRLFAAHAHDALSAEDVRRLMAAQHERVGLATVYRTLDLFAQLDVLNRLPGADGRARFRLNPRHLQRQHQLVCVRCGELAEVAADWLRGLAEQVLEDTGFRVLEPELKLYGVCAACGGK
jgi:Fur family ferric uptake transcriptional regulator